MRSLWWDQHDDEAGRTPQRRGLWLALVWGAGSLVGLHVEALSASVVVGLCAACVLAAALTRGWVCRGVLIVAALGVSALWTNHRVHHPEASSLLARGSSIAPGERALVTITGVLTSDPSPVRRFDPYGAYERRTGAGVQLTVNVSTVGKGKSVEPSSGEVVVNVYSPMPKLAAGQWVRVSGWLSPVQGPMNPGQRDGRWWAAQDGQGGWMTVSNAELIESVDRPRGASSWASSQMWAGLARLRAGAQGLLDSALDSKALTPGVVEQASEREQSRATLEALLVGTYEPEVREVSQAFTRLGLVHALSISGFHIAVLAGVILFLVRLTGDRGWIEPVIVASLVVVYLLIVPARAPMVRSGVMVLALLIAEAMDRRYDRLNLLGYIAVALLIWRPLDLLDAGFQLSFGVTGALMWLGRPVYERWFARGVKGRSREPARGVVGWVGDAVRKLGSSCLLAWGVSTPAVMFHAGVLSPLAAVTSVVVLPIVTVTLWVGYVALVIEALTRAAGVRLGLGGWMLEHMGVALVRVTAWIDRLPGMAVMMPPVSTAWAAASTVVIVWWLRWPARARVWRWLAGAGCVVWLGVMMVKAGSIGEDRVRVDKLSVSPGSCTIVRAGNLTMLVDAGAAGVESGERTISRAAREIGAWRVPIVVLTHSAPEHWRALPGLVRTLGVRQVLMSPSLSRLAEDRPDGPHARAMRELRALGVEVRSLEDGQSMDVGDERTRVSFAVGTRDGLRPHEVMVTIESGEGRIAIGPSAMITDRRSNAQERIVTDAKRESGSGTEGAMSVRIDRDGKIVRAASVGGN